MKILLHIGTESTGTSSLQEFLFLNAELLKGQQVYIPKVDQTNHRSLVIYSANSTQTIWDLLVAKNINPEQPLMEIQSSIKINIEKEFITIGKETENVIFSSEHCSSRLRSLEELTRLKEFLENFSKAITPIIYIRRQDDFIYSQYFNHIKNGGDQNLKEFLLKYDRTLCDYSIMLDLWSRVFGRPNLIIKVFDKDTMTNKSLIDDFLCTVGIDRRPEFNYPPLRNCSYDMPILNFLRHLNHQIPVYKNKTLNPNRFDLDEIMDLISDSQKKQTPEDKQFLYDFYMQFQVSNNFVARKYFNRDSLFNKPPLNLACGETGGTGNELDEAFRIFALIWVAKCHSTNQLLSAASIKNHEIMKELNSVHDKSTELIELINSMIKSRSWRLTQPIRALSYFFRKKLIRKYEG